MALDDNAVVVAAKGYVFTADVGTAAPSPDDVDTLDPELFGCQTVTFAVTGTPTGGSFTVKFASGDTPATIPWNATPDQVQTLVEALASVGADNTSVAGAALPAGTITVTFCEALEGETLTATVVDAGLTGGSTPHATVTTTTAALTWKMVGHTSREKMPEFGFSGGKPKLRGTWQRKALREVMPNEPEEDYIMLRLEQFDVDVLNLYYGDLDTSVNGVVGVPGENPPIEKAVLVWIVDGDTALAFYAPKAAIERDASIDLPIDDFTGFPIKATFLDLPRKKRFYWISKDLLGTAV